MNPSSILRRSAMRRRAFLGWVGLALPALGLRGARLRAAEAKEGKLRVVVFGAHPDELKRLFPFR